MRTEELRHVVEALDLEMTRLQARGGPAGGDTMAVLYRWAELVELLALGPAPRLLACPSCGALGMRAATRCGFCWRKLEPPKVPSA